MAYNASAISTVKKLTLVPIVGYLEDLLGLLKMLTNLVQVQTMRKVTVHCQKQQYRVSSKNNWHHNSTAQQGIQKIQTTELTVYLENLHAGNLLAK